MTPNILRNILNIVTVPPLGSFEGLDYNGLTLVNAADAITGTRPQSGSNVLGWYAGSVALNGQPTIEAPGAPNAVDVGLKSLYFACIVPTFIPVITLPVPCTLSVEGYDDKDNIVASTSKTFDAAIIDPVTFAVRLTRPMQKFDLPESFSSKPLKRVTLELEPPFSLVGVGLVDTLEEDLYFVEGVIGDI
ncbi:hypothetical protein Slin14017_G097480 [Septoria linicola]|nr:hypothetical protein Slin14017_G097480 [Septoria linicola]